MAKDDRAILSSIRMPLGEGKSRVTYGPGMEDELAAAASPEQLRSWLDSGAIAGNWTKAAKAKEK